MALSALPQNLIRPTSLASKTLKTCSGTRLTHSGASIHLRHRPTLNAARTHTLPQTAATSRSNGHIRSIHTTATLRDSSFTNVLADDTPPAVQVSSISNEGIRLLDGLLLPGPCIFLEGKVFLWDVDNANVNSRVRADRWKEWNKDYFQILEAVTPRPEMLILGTGKTLVQPPPFLKDYLISIGIQLDVMDTRNACSTYNLLSEEGRRVAAALLPVTPYKWPKTTIPSSSSS